MENLIVNSNGRYIEICQMPEDDVAGRVKIKMSALKINENNSTYNDNGIAWLEEYILANKESIIGAPYVVSWLTTKEDGIPSNHGRQSYDEEGNVQFEGDAVGSIQDADIEEVEIDGVMTKVLMTSGFIYKQRNSKFYEWLKEEMENGTIFGSIEINGKGKAKVIEYLDGANNEDGTLKMGRVPTVFDFSALAILYLTEPSDKNSMIFEINSKEGEKLDIVKKSTTVEINKISYDDIATLVSRAFNSAMNIDYWDYYIHKFYPIEGQVVFKKWDECSYYMTSYKVENNTVTLGDIVKVEEDWKIVESTPVEINNEKIKEIINNEKNEEGGTDDMKDTELNAKVEELNKEVTELNAKIAELNTTVAEKDAKIVELNEVVVESNKKLEEVTTKVSTLEVEVNEYKEKEAKIEEDKKIAEVNAYFENEIPKNKFEESEVNTLKEFVEKNDLDGLKKAEAELIVAKFKAGTKTVEVNEKKDDELFFSTKEEKIDDVTAGKSLFV
jgi:outer membrane murein-binding lipoprotein Lpp